MFTRPNRPPDRCQWPASSCYEMARWSRRRGRVQCASAVARELAFKCGSEFAPCHPAKQAPRYADGLANSWGRVPDPGCDEVNGRLFHTDKTVVMQSLTRITRRVVSATHQDLLFYRCILQAFDNGGNFMGSANIATVLFMMHDEHGDSDSFQILSGNGTRFPETHNA